MCETTVYIRNAGIIRVIAAVLLLCLSLGCKTPREIFTIGVVGHLIKGPGFQDFVKGMTELGYVEDRDYRFIYQDVPELTDRTIDEQIKKLLARDPDMLLIKENEVALRAKKLVGGTDMPILLIGSPSPVETGIVDSISRPGGNITGVKVIDSAPKALEWLIRITPDARKVWLPCDRDDPISALELAKLERVVPQLGIELVTQRISSVEETVDAIIHLPEDIDAVFFIPSAILSGESRRLNRAAIERGLPTGASLGLDEGVLITLKADMSDGGRRAARMARQIMQGVRPADIPVETSEARLIINLSTAHEIGLVVPDDILSQATDIIR